MSRRDPPSGSGSFQLELSENVLGGLAQRVIYIVRHARVGCFSVENEWRVVVTRSDECSGSFIKEETSIPMRPNERGQ